MNIKLPTTTPVGPLQKSGSQPIFYMQVELTTKNKVSVAGRREQRFEQKQHVFSREKNIKLLFYTYHGSSIEHS